MKKKFQIKVFCVLSTTCLLTQTVFAQHIESPLRNQWTTHYFGRFKLDLPAGSEVVSDYKLYNEKVELIGKNGTFDLVSAVAQKTDELKKGIAYGTSSRYEKTVPLSNGSVLILSKLGDFYTFHAYFLTSKNTLYRMIAQSISANGIDGAINKARLISESIYYRRPSDAPPAGAFALEEGYTTLGAAQSLEGIYMGAQISTHPGTFVSLLTQRIVEHDENLIQRFESESGGGLASGMMQILSKTKTLRKRERRVGSLKAEEVAIATLIDGKRFYTFQIEYAGLLKSNTTPFIELRLGTHEVGSDFKSDEEALAFWDSVVDSLRPLP